jgi:hypothetical protein
MNAAGFIYKSGAVKAIDAKLKKLHHDIQTDLTTNP